MQMPKDSSFWLQIQTIIMEKSKEFDQKWRVRKRVITTQFLVLFIFKLVLSRNKQGYGSLLAELWGAASSLEALDLPQATPVCASSVCVARQKLPETIFQQINQEVLRYWSESRPDKRWKGHQVFAVDGSKLNLPRPLVDAGYLANDSDRQRYPSGLLSSLYHLGEGMVYDFKLTPNKDERLCAIEHMDVMNPEDVMVLDRGYFSYLLLHRSQEKKIFIVCRLQGGSMNPEIEKFIAGDEMDKVIDYSPSKSTQSDLKKRGFHLDFKTIRLRLIKYHIENETYVCATTLIRPEYSIEELAQLYHGRWGIEELYKISKRHIEVDDFHSQTERGVKQEVYAHFVLINIARIFESQADNPSEMHQAQSDSDLKDSYWQGFSKGLRAMKINFKNCLIVLRQYLEKLMLSNDRACFQSWVSEMISLIARVRQRIRPGRHYQRQSFKPLSKWMASYKMAEASSA